MPWGRLDDRCNGDAKLIALSDSAWRMWGCGLIYCQFNLTDGFIPEHAIHTFGVRAKNKKAVIDELCVSLVPGKGPLWHRVEGGGYRVHDYLVWNDSREKVLKEREQGKDRLKRFRERHANGGPTPIETPLQTPFERLSTTTTTTTTDGSTGREPSESPARAKTKTPHAVAHDGPRLRVWHWQHEDLGKRLGAKVDDFDLLGWYSRLEAELERSGEAFADPWKWLQVRLYSDAGLPLPNLMGRTVRQPQIARGDDWNCPHEKKCHTRHWCEVVMPVKLADAAAARAQAEAAQK